jgi:SAM-dependent methyltransferase
MLRPLCRELAVGVDRSQGMLEEARRRLSGPGAPVSLVRGDALNPPIRETFDLVVSFGAFGHILEEDEPRFVQSVKGLLRPGGRFAFYSSYMPSLTNPGYWVAWGFNAAMRVRNALLKPQFIMYYLTFLVPRARALLEAEGFSVELRSRVPPPPFQSLELVIATRR